MIKVDIGGVLIDTKTKNEVLAEIDNIIPSNKSEYIVTPYSEMIVFAMNDFKYRNILNEAKIAIPDGIGVLWAAAYLNSKKSLLGSLFAIIFNKSFIKSVIPEQITGSRLIYDISKLAAQKNYSISLVGGQGRVAEKSADRLKRLFPSLNIKLAISGRAFDDQMVQEINQSSSDILFIAYSPPKQEKWLAQNINRLNVKLAIGLGGTFDYLAGVRPTAPKFFRNKGLEWLWRLITQPYRWKRMWNAIPVFVWKIRKHKRNRPRGLKL